MRGFCKMEQEEEEEEEQQQQQEIPEFNGV